MNDRAERECVMLKKKLDFEGKIVLDLGCGAGDITRYIAANYEPKEIVGMDMRSLSETGERFRLESGDARHLPYEDNTFDIVFSLATFEHINGISETLAEIRRVLKPRGKFYTTFSPIWTGVVGNHVYCAGVEKTLQGGCVHDEKILYGIPAWGHLYMSADELAEHLSKLDFSEETIKKIIFYVYEHNDINRSTATETRQCIMNAGMIVKSYEEYITFTRKWALNQKGPSELTEDIVSRLRHTKYNLNDIGIIGMRAMLEKYESLIV